MPRIAPLRNTLSRPLSSGWNPVPTSSRLPTRPWTSARPPVGSVILDRIRNSVLLPAPFLPTIPTVCPRGTSKETSLSAHTWGGSSGPRESRRPIARIAPAIVSRSDLYRAASPSRYFFDRPAQEIASEPITSQHVGERPLHPPEVERSGDQHDDRRDTRHDDHRARRRRQAEQDPSEPFDDPGHRIEPVDRAPWFAQQAARVRDRRREQPELDHERQHVADV